MISNEIESNKILTESSQEITVLNGNSIANWVTNPYLKAATSDNTRKAYRSDIKHYEQWGGLLPATPEKNYSVSPSFRRDTQLSYSFPPFDCHQTLAHLSRLP